MLQPGLRARERHAMSVKASTGFFPQTEDNESWRAAHRITAMFNTIAGEIERNPSRTGGATPSGTPLAQAWKIWGRWPTGHGTPLSDAEPRSAAPELTPRGTRRPSIPYGMAN